LTAAATLAGHLLNLYHHEFRWLHRGEADRVFTKRWSMLDGGLFSSSQWTK
jgi:hypothetical protein